MLLDKIQQSFFLTLKGKMYPFDMFCRKEKHDIRIFYTFIYNLRGETMTVVYVIYFLHDKTFEFVA